MSLVQYSNFIPYDYGTLVLQYYVIMMSYVINNMVLWYYTTIYHIYLII